MPDEIYAERRRAVEVPKISPFPVAGATVFPGKTEIVPHTRARLADSDEIPTKGRTCRGRSFSFV